MIDLKILIKSYIKFYLITITSAILIFILLNIFYFKLTTLNYTGNASLFSVPKYSIPEVEEGIYSINGKIDKLGLDLFTLSENAILTEGYNNFYKEVEKNLTKNIAFLNKFDNNPDLFIKFLKIDNSMIDNIPASLDFSAFVVTSSTISKGIIEILNVQMLIEGSNPVDIRNFLHDKISNSAILFRDFMRLQISNFTNELIKENEIKILKITELLNIRIEYLDNQLSIARQQNIIEPVRASIEQGTEYLKGVNLLSLEISKVRSDLKNLNNGNHYLLYDNTLLINNIKNSVFLKDDILTEKNILFTFFYDKDFISISKSINSKLLNLFTYFMIFSTLIIISITMIHFYFYSKKFNN